MPTFVMLLRLTEHGIQHISESPQRIKICTQMFESAGAKMKDFYALMGHYNAMMIVEADSEAIMAQLTLQIAKFGNVKVETLHAFTEKEYVDIVSKVK